jgi:hypothetical protein
VSKQSFNSSRRKENNAVSNKSESESIKKESNVDEESIEELNLSSFQGKDG